MNVADNVPDRLDLASTAVIGVLAVVVMSGFLVLAFLWFRSLIHLFTHEDVPNRVIWILAHFIGLQLFAGLVYWLVVQRGYQPEQVIEVERTDVGADGRPTKP